MSLTAHVNCASNKYSITSSPIYYPINYSYSTLTCTIDSITTTTTTNNNLRCAFGYYVDDKKYTLNSSTFSPTSGTTFNLSTVPSTATKVFLEITKVYNVGKWSIETSRVLAKNFSSYITNGQTNLNYIADDMDSYSFSKTLTASTTNAYTDAFTLYGGDVKCSSVTFSTTPAKAFSCGLAWGFNVNYSVTDTTSKTITLVPNNTWQPTWGSSVDFAFSWDPHTTPTSYGSSNSFCSCAFIKFNFPSGLSSNRRLIWSDGTVAASSVTSGNVIAVPLYKTSISYQSKDTGSWITKYTITLSNIWDGTIHTFSENTSKVKVSGTWKDAIVYVYNSNTWKPASAYVRSNSSWKQCT